MQLHSRTSAPTAGEADQGKIRILIVDDHPAIGEALATLIRSRLDVDFIGQAFSADEGLTMARKQHPDVAIVDISLGDAHGLELVHNLRIQTPKIRVVIYSMYDDAVYAERALRSGALGYVMKTEPTQLVLEAIRTVAEGHVFLSRRMASRILSKVAFGDTPDPMFAVDELTDREMEVFHMLGEGCGVERITEKLNLSRKTIEAYRRRVKNKLGLNSIEELLQYAIEWSHSNVSVRDSRGSRIYEAYEG